MFLTLGMTADAAAAHRHEFSTPRSSPQPQYRHSIAPRSPLPKPSPSPSRPGAPELTRRPASFAAPTSFTAPRSAQSVMFADAETDISSGDALSINGSTSSRPTIRAKARRAVARSKTSFQLAHPPPVQIHKQRLKIRPRLLLQLQLISAATRPTPAFDVLPSTIFAPRLARRFPRVFKGKDGLGANDLVIVSNEEYNAPPAAAADASDDSDEGGWESREVIGTICQMRKEEGGSQGKAEICLDSGPSWHAMPLMNGGYEFVSIDDKGATTTARWVPRIAASRRRSYNVQSQTSPNGIEDEKKFTFSIINPQSRRHPIIASMTRHTIDVLDQYPSASSSTALHPTSPMHTPSIMSDQGSFFDVPIAQERVLIPTDARLRTLILVTGIWVSFRENWSQNFKYNDNMACLLPSSTVNPHHSNSRQRTASVPPNGDIQRDGSTPDSDDPRYSGHDGIGGKILRTGTHLLRHRSTISTAAEDLGSSPLPRRANSTGTAFMERANNRSRSAARRNSQIIPGTPLNEIDGERLSMQQKSGSTVSERTCVISQQPPTPTPVNKKAERTRGNGPVDDRPGRRLAGPQADGNAELAPNGDRHRPANEEKKKVGKIRGLINLIKRTSGARSR